MFDRHRKFTATALLALVVLAGCSRDLAVPEQPQRGEVLGRLDTQGYTSPENKPVALLRDDGRRYEVRTASDGTFRFTDVLPGSYFVQVTLPNFAPLVLPGVRVAGVSEVDVGALQPAWMLGSASVGALFLRGRLADGAPSAEVAARESATLEVAGSTMTAFVAGSTTLLPDSCPQASAPEWRPLPGDGRIAVTLAGEGAVRAAWVCLKDGAGAVVGPRFAVIAWDATPPSGCALTLTGQRTDGAAAPAGRTATTSVAAAVSGCGEAPSDVVLSNTPVACDDEAGLPWQSFAAQRPWTLPTGDGQHTVYGCVRDTARNTSGLIPASLELDTTPPLAPAVTLEGGATHLGAAAVAARGGTRRVDVTGTATDAVQWAVGTDPGALGPFSAFPPAAPASLTFASDGTQTGWAAFRDDVGNTTVAVSDTIVVDTAAPTGGFLVEGTLRDGTVSTTLTSTTAVTLALDVQGATAWLAGTEALTECTGTWAPLTRARVEHTLPALEGTREVRLCVRDDAGNVLGPLARSIVLDGTAPVGCALTVSGRTVDGAPAPAGRTGSALVDVAVGGCAAQAPTGVVLSGTPLGCTSGASYPWTAWAPSQPFTLAGADGPKTVYGCVRDAAGNVAALAQGSVTLDTQPPTAPFVTLDGGAAYVNAAQVGGGARTATLSGTAADATHWAVGTSPTALGPFTTFTSGVSTAQLTFPADGVQSGYAVFRDDVGNATAVASDAIVFDVVPPAAGTLAITTPSGNAYSSSVSVTLGLAAPADAAALQLGNAASPVGCAPADVASAAQEAVVGNRVFLLPSGDGLKRVCARYVDAAGNAGAVFGATVTLDTVPPTAPQITNVSEIRRDPDNSPYVVNIAGPVTEANFARYERQGGQDAAWTLASTSLAQTSFTFRVVSFLDFSRPAGIENTLRLRAVDLAGNTSESFVVVTEDLTPPEPVQLDALWTTNGDAKGTVYWQPSTSPDVVDYQVLYGSSSAEGSLDYDGAYADQGRSPVSAGKTNKMTLSGLTNGARTFVTVRPVDRAGNVGDRAAEVVLQPNEVSPTLIGAVRLEGSRRDSTPYYDYASYLAKLAAQGSYLYALAVNGDSNASSPTLRVFDIGRLVSQVQTGTVDAAAPGPAQVAQLDFSDALSWNTAVYNQFDLVVDGPYAFVAVNNRLRVIRILTPTAPQLVATVDFHVNSTGVPALVPNALRNLQVRGRRLYVSTERLPQTLDLSSLYDGNAGHTLPASVIHTYALAGAPPSGVSTSSGVGLTWTRDWLLSAPSSGSSSVFRASDLVQQGGAGPTLNTAGNFSPVVSGNYLYAAEYARFAVYDVSGVWAGGVPSATPVGSAAVDARGQFSVAGGQAFVMDTVASGVRSFNLDAATQPTDTGFTLSTTNYSGVESALLWGNYLFTGNASAELAVYEVATPQSLHRVATGNTGGSTAQVSGGFLFTGANVLDLQNLNANGTPPAVGTDPDSNNCAFDVAYFDEQAVQAQGPRLRVVNLEAATDRNGVGLAAGDATSVNHPTAGTYITGVEAYGGFLLTAQQRADGVWLELFDAGTLRDRTLPGFALSSLGAFRVTTTVARADVSLHRGRALVTLDGRRVDGTTTSGGGLYVVDVRPLLDDTAATTMTAAHVLQFVPADTPRFGYSPGHRQAVGRGGHVYVASNAGLEVYELTPVLDEDAATAPVSPPPAAPTVVMEEVQSVAMHGSHLLMVPLIPSTNAHIVSVDVSTPLQPRVVSSLPFMTNQPSCQPSGVALPGWIPQRAGLTVAGTRAYVTKDGLLSVIELE